MCTMSQEGCDRFPCVASDTMCLALLAPLHAGGLSTLESTDFVDHNRIHTVKVAMPPYDIWSAPPPTIISMSCLQLFTLLKPPEGGMPSDNIDDIAVPPPPWKKGTLACLESRSPYAM